MDERDIELARSLAASGCALDREIRQKTKDLAKSFSKHDFFLLAIAQSLTWTGHAIDKDDYFNKALDFLSTGSAKALSALSKCYGRYGAEKLRSTIFNWRKLCSELTIPSNILMSQLDEIIRFQNTSLDIACTARQKGRIIGIGAWLFCAPLKIILCLRDKLWNDRRVDEILMPLGLEVVRGVKKLKRQKYSYSDSFEIGYLSEEEGGIVEGLGIIHIVQAMSKDIAKDANSNVLHINSGLWKFGAGDL